MAIPDDLSAQILLLDPRTRAGRTGHRLRVKDAREYRAIVRDMMGNSRDDTPSTLAILRAATYLSKLLDDATNGGARIRVGIGNEAYLPGAVHSTLVDAIREDERRARQARDNRHDPPELSGA
jgi:hypothetical protein